MFGARRFANKLPATWFAEAADTTIYTSLADDKPQLHPFTYTYLNKISVYLFTVMHIITF